MIMSRIETPLGVLALERVTPEMAATHLADARRQPVDAGKVARYAEAMRNGLWREQTDWPDAGRTPVIFNCDGTVVEGNHRLEAVVISGATASLWVLRLRSRFGLPLLLGFLLRREAGQ
jgi:hypothetical protein